MTQPVAPPALPPGGLPPAGIVGTVGTVGTAPVPVQATTPTGAKVFRDAQGVFSVDDADVPAALAKGAVPLSPDEFAAHQAQRAAEQAAAAQEAAREAALQQAHGDIAGQLVAAGSKALETIPFAGPTLYSIAPESIKDEVRQDQKANPTASTLGTVGGLVGGLVEGTTEAKVAKAALDATEGIAAREASGIAGALESKAVTGLEEATTAGAAEARAAQAAAIPAPSIARQVLSTVGAPQRLVGEVGAKAASFVEKAIGDSAKTAATRLATKAAVLAAQGGAEGAIYGANDYLTEDALSKDPEYDGEKLLYSMGVGTLLGFGTGGLLGAGGGVLEEYVAPAAESLSGRLGLRAFLGGRDSGAIKALEKVGGAEKVGNVAMADGLIKPGRAVDELLPGVIAKDQELSAKVAAARDLADSLGAEGVTKAEVLKPFQEEIDRMSKDYTVSQGQVNEITAMRNKLAAQLGIDAESASRAIPAVNEEAIRVHVAQQFLEHADTVAGTPAALLHTPEAFEAASEAAITKAQRAQQDAIRKAQKDAIQEALDKRASAVEEFQKGKGDYVKYADLAAIRGSLDGKVNWRAQTQIENESRNAYVAIRGKLERALEEGLDKADKVFSGTQLATYKADKLHFRQIRTLREIAERASLARQKNNVVGLGATVAAAGAMHLAAGPAGLATGLAGALGTKLAKDRGMSTAAVLADKIHSLTAVGKASAEADQRIVRGVNGALDGRVPKDLGIPSHPYRSFEDKVAAVREAVANPQALQEHLTRVAGSLPQHAPKTANAFVSSGVRAAQYLASVAPKVRPVNPMQPNGPKIEPTDHEKHVFEKQFEAVHHPASVLVDAAKGTLVPQQVAAVAAVSPKALAHMNRLVLAEYAKETEPPTLKKMLMISTLTGKKGSPILEQQNTAMLQASFQPEKGGPSSGAGHAPASRAVPKASNLPNARNSSLDPARLER